LYDTKTFQQAASTRWTRASLLATASLAAIAAWLAAPLGAQPIELPPPLPQQAPLGDPIVSANAVFAATRVTAWHEGDARVLLLDGDASFQLGAYGFCARRAVVRIEPETRAGERVSHLSVYLEDARPLMTAGPVTAEASRLLVTAATTGGVELSADALTTADRRPTDRFVDDADARLARHRQRLDRAPFDVPTPVLFGPEADALRQTRRAEIAQQQLALAVRGLPVATVERDRTRAAAVVESPEREPAEEHLDEVTVVPPPTPAPPPRENTVLPSRGAVYLDAERIVGSATDNTVMLIGNASVVYQSHEGDERSLALRAERVVVFLADADAADAQAAGQAGTALAAGNITGVYLEENVILTDHDFTIRAPRMYFDLETNRAVLLEAVLFTYDVRRQVPLYLRAELVRQTSATSFEAQNALLTTSEFAEPHVAIASDRVTLTRDTTGETVDSFTASHNVVRLGTVPVFYWPYLAGDNRDTPLRRVSAGYSSNSGFELQTWWDVFALAGQPRPEGVDASLRLDYRGHHGPAVGLVGDYQRDRMFGRLNTYLLPYDQGEDRIAGRRDIEWDGDVRGIFHWQHRQYLPNELELSIETSYLSDPTFLEEFFEGDLYRSREYETSAYLKRQENDWAATALVKYNLNDFTPLLTTLQTPGYTVDRLPELGYYRVGTSLWDDRLTYFTENRVSYLRIRPGEDSPGERGFGNARALEFFGIPAATTFEDAFDAAGVPDNLLWRIDSRHEINAPLTVGIFNVTPYVAGRVTFYDQDFEDFAGEDDQFRLWGQVGSRASTRFVNTYEGARSRLFDVHRLRHVVEPSVNVFYAATTIDRGDLPVFDNTVENIAEGAGVVFGLTNTLQTQRGPEGRRRQVDWITLRTDVVLRESDDEPFGEEDARIARFFGYRPEFATGGDHFYTELLWMVTDTFGMVGELTHSFDTNRVVQWRVGGTIRHTPAFAIFAEYEEYDPLDLALVRYGFNYQLSAKYRLAVTHTLDFGGSGARRVTGSLERRLSRWRLRLIGSYNETRDETVFGLVLIPEGFDVGEPRIPLNQLLGAF
jgi:hypothetical protein